LEQEKIFREKITYSIYRLCRAALLSGVQATVLAGIAKVDYRNMGIGGIKRLRLVRRGHSG
jgi:hypothetical protein